MARPARCVGQGNCRVAAGQANRNPRPMKLKMRTHGGRAKNRLSRACRRTSGGWSTNNRPRQMIGPRQNNSSRKTVPGCDPQQRTVKWTGIAANSPAGRTALHVQLGSTPPSANKPQGLPFSTASVSGLASDAVRLP